MIAPTLAHGPAQGFARTLTGQGPRTRVRLDGPGTEPTVRAALTRVWRLAGQPLTVVVPTHRDPVGDVAAAWAAEHHVAGIRVEHRTSDASSAPCVVVPAAGPVPWCGCVEPPCGRCLDDGSSGAPLAHDGPLTPLRNAAERRTPRSGSPAYPQSLRAAEGRS